MLEVAEGQTAPISMVGASPEAIRLGKIFYAAMLTKTEGEAFSIVHITQRGAGAEAWTLLRAEYAGSSRSGMPERSMVGRCECWQGFPDDID